MSAVDVELVCRLYRSVKRIRRVEEVTAEIYPSDKIKSPVHLSIGQEQVSTAVCDVLEPTDVVGGTYRSHALYLAKGGRADAMIAEMYGKDTGCCRGKGGSMHLMEPDVCVLGSSAVVGTGISNAAGYALAIKRRREPRVVAVFFGDGATEEGCFYETLNFAALMRLPLLFVCENNGYAIHEPLSKRRAQPDLYRIAEVIGVPAVHVDDGDIFALRAAAAEAVTAIRAGQGPRFLEARVYRWREHVGPNEDYDQGYRDRTEADPWMRSDEVARLAGLLDKATRTRIDAEIESEVAEAVAFAESSPIPTADQLMTHVYA